MVIIFVFALLKMNRNLTSAKHSAMSGSQGMTCSRALHTLVVASSTVNLVGLVALPNREVGLLSKSISPLPYPPSGLDFCKSQISLLLCNISWCKMQYTALGHVAGELCEVIQEGTVSHDVTDWITSLPKIFLCRSFKTQNHGLPKEKNLHQRRGKLIAINSR